VHPEARWTASRRSTAPLSAGPSPITGYSAFEEGLDGGFHTESAAKPLPILFSTDLERTLAAVEEAGGSIVKPIFEFPGGRRFHFLDPAGNELAVWADL
jgi:uncharacterized protein